MIKRLLDVLSAGWPFLLLVVVLAHWFLNRQ
jgi:hypothetical protein